MTKSVHDVVKFDCKDRNSYFVDSPHNPGVVFLVEPKHHKTYPRKRAPNEDSNQTAITKTRLYNFDPLKPHFYIVKLGFTGVYIIFRISTQSINCVYLLEPPRTASSRRF